MGVPFKSLLRLVGLASPPASPNPGEVWYDTSIPALRMYDGTYSQVLQADVESFGRIDIIGHSLMAEGGVGPFGMSSGSMHKVVNQFPARFRNLAIGGALAVNPGTAGPAAGAAAVQAGWAYIYDLYRNRERQGGWAVSAAAPGGINTTLSGALTAPVAAGTSIAVVSSANWNTSGEQYVPVMIGRGATAEMNWLQASADGTHVNIYNALANNHASGEPVVACPDSYLSNKQLILLGYDMNDLGWMGITTWQTAFIHAYRAIIARARCMCMFEDDSVLVRQTAGTWNTNVTTGGLAGSSASGNRFLSTSSAGAQVTLDIPVNFPGNGANVVLYFLTDLNGGGALWDISVDGGANVQHDTRNINGFANGSTRAATGRWMASVKVLRGLAAGAHTITVTINTLNGSAYFDGFGITPPDPPPIIIVKPRRAYSYSLFAGWSYQPVDADIATMNTSIDSLIAEWTGEGSGGGAGSYVVGLTMDAIINKQFKFFWADGIHYNDAGHAEVAIALTALLKNTYIPIRNQLLPTPSDNRGWYQVYAAGSGLGYAQFLNNWANYNQAGVNNPLAFYKDQSTGMVYVQGEIAKANWTDNPGLAIFQLPIGHRPARQWQFAVSAYGGNGMVAVNQDGNVQLLMDEPRGAATTAWVSLDFFFPAEGLM